jgi:hypothetical protein
MANSHGKNRRNSFLFISLITFTIVGVGSLTGLIATNPSNYISGTFVNLGATLHSAFAQDSGGDYRHPVMTLLF